VNVKTITRALRFLEIVEAQHSVEETKQQDVHYVQIPIIVDESEGTIELKVEGPENERDSNRLLVSFAISAELSHIGKVKVAGREMGRHLWINFDVENAEVQKLFEHHIAHLHEELRSHGFSVGAIQVNLLRDTAPLLYPPLTIDVKV